MNFQIWAWGKEKGKGTAQQPHLKGVLDEISNLFRQSQIVSFAIFLANSTACVLSGV